MMPEITNAQPMPTSTVDPAQEGQEGLVRDPSKLTCDAEDLNQVGFHNTCTPDASPLTPTHPSYPNQVTPSSAPPKTTVANPHLAQFHNFQPTNRGRVVSLDRGQDLLKMDMTEERSSSSHRSPSDNVGTRHAHHRGNFHAPRSHSPDDADDDSHSYGSNSSDGESSYFAKHLPSPKSGGRRFSYSDSASIASAPAPATYFASSSSVHRESDASLSFSDDDEDDDDNDLHAQVNIISRSARGIVLPPPLPKEPMDDLQVYPQRIVRMHSVSSLVSSTSDDGARRAQQAAEQDRWSVKAASTASSSSEESVGTSSDPSVRSELRDVAAPTGTRNLSRESTKPSGRISPVLGEASDRIVPHQNLGYLAPFYSSPPAPQMSPPTIFQGYPNAHAPEVAHPQPMNPEKMAAWTAAGHTAAQIIPQSYFSVPQSVYGATVMGPPFITNNPEIVSSGLQSGEYISRSAGEASQITLPLVYSEDEDTDESAMFGQRLASGLGVPVSQAYGKSSFNAKMGEGDTLPEHDRSENYATKGADFQARNVAAAQQSDYDDYYDNPAEHEGQDSGQGFRVYWQRWMMLAYMSVLNLLSDWTCYSVAPISVLTSEAFGRINPEQLVVVFLGANSISTACEPIILSRLGLRGTVIFGALLLMLGSIIKSGGLPPIIQSNLTKGEGEWRVYLGFFLVGLSQPLYQCTPALLSASWFPERERTMATGVALNSNQLGIGFAFIFGTLLVADSDDIVKYFGLLSLISTVTCIGCIIQFDDAPPTPPSDTARAMRGTLDFRLPNVDTIWRSVRSLGPLKDITREDDDSPTERPDNNPSPAKMDPSSPEPSPSSSFQKRTGDGQTNSNAKSNPDASRKTRKSARSSSSRKSSSRSPQTSSKTRPQLSRQGSGSGGMSGNGSAGSNTRRRTNASSRKRTANTDSGLGIGMSGVGAPPSPASTGERTSASLEIARLEQEAYDSSVLPPSPMIPGPVGPPSADTNHREEDSPLYEEGDFPERHDQIGVADPRSLPVDQYINAYPPIPGMPFNGAPFPQWQQPYWNPHFQQQAYYQHPGYMPQGHFQQQGYYYYPPGQYFHPQIYPPRFANDHQYSGNESTSSVDEGLEPVVTITNHHLDIDIRDDQVILSARACLSRPGFVHALVAFTVSGIVINTLSTFMDYLVRLNGAGREYVGIVGGSFQFVIMISSLIVGRQTDRTRAYYSVTIAMLVLGAFALAECGVNLDADRGTDLRWSLIIVAALVGPLQPVSTELGVDVAYPLSENTVLVIQQLFSNLLSAMFIPFFKALRDVGTQAFEDAELFERPQYTFSFYLLIVVHAAATVFFATFNGRYLRYEHEQEKKTREEQRRAGATAFYPIHDNSYEQQGHFGDGERVGYSGERQPLVNTVV